MTSEFSLIEKYFTRPSKNVDLGIGDDAALLRGKIGYQLAISTDMLVVGTHFFADTSPESVGWKALAVNISDMAAMGATPKWATLALALPEANESWLAAFSRGFFACATAFNVSLIGGDTTRGPLNISVTIIGEIPTDKALRRDRAQVGDAIWVSGELGNAALGLAHLQNEITLASAQKTISLKALHTPQPRVALGLALSGLANSAIDISDGLLSDLGHILKTSKLGANIKLSEIPCSIYANNHLHETFLQHCVLAGGDDYELCFTAPENAHQSIVELSKRLSLKLTKIGNTSSEKGLKVHGLNGELVNINKAGFDHFST